jgi:multidrug efflux pump subunit AcrB
MGTEVELQPADDLDLVESTENEAEQAEPSETEAGSAPEQGQKKVEFTPEQQAIFDRTIGDKVRKQREAERNAEQVRQELERVRAMLPKDSRPDVPSMPDPYDEDFAQKVAARDKALTNAAAWDMRQAMAEHQRLEQATRQQQEQQQALSRSVETYSKRATAFGIKADELAAAGQAVANYGISQDLASFILADDKGPLITAYLARNPLELDALQGMSPLQAAVHIATNIKARAAASRGISSAPEPPTVLGTGGVPKREPGPKGARYE